MSSCDKSFNEPIAPVETTEQLQDEDVSSPELRASNITYYSTPGVGETVPNSTVNIKGKGTATYHGGVLAAKVLRQNGNKFTIRIFKQDGGAFTGGGLAMIISETPDGGDFCAHKRYYPGDTHVDIEITADFDKGAVHFYPSTIASPSRYRYYAEPILVYTDPMYRTDYTYGKVLGTFNRVNVICNTGRKQNIGDGWYQCVEFCKRYYKDVYGKTLGSFQGKARNLFGLANSKGLDAFRNGGSVAPRPGDILCFDWGTKNKQGEYLGHVAIIMEVSDNQIKIAQQNSGTEALGAAWAPIGGVLSRNGNTISAPSGFKVQGWVRIRVN